jgi:[CysO sulfur-carrier protein]-S-L-cysteine hydrolase
MSNCRNKRPLPLQCECSPVSRLLSVPDGSYALSAIVVYRGVRIIRERALAEHPPAGLRLDLATYNTILAHFRAWSPNEGCGLLATTFEPDGNAERVAQFYPGSNLHGSPTSFEMDPKEVVAALKEIEARGWRLGAIVHSHPTTAAKPSQTDLRQAYYPGALMVIVSLQEATPVIRAWQVSMSEEMAHVVGEALVIVD